MVNEKIYDIIAYSVHCDIFLQGLGSRGISLVGEDGEEVCEDVLADIAAMSWSLSNMEVTEDAAN